MSIWRDLGGELDEHAWYRDMWNNEAEIMRRFHEPPPGTIIVPPLPQGYRVLIHRDGQPIYKDNSTNNWSWKHPVKLAQLKALDLALRTGASGELLMREKKVGMDGYYLVDYAHPDLGRIYSFDVRIGEYGPMFG